MVSFGTESKFFFQKLFFSELIFKRFIIHKNQTFNLYKWEETRRKLHCSKFNSPQIVNKTKSRRTIFKSVGKMTSRTKPGPIPSPHRLLPSCLWSYNTLSFTSLPLGRGDATAVAATAIRTAIIVFIVLAVHRVNNDCQLSEEIAAFWSRDPFYRKISAPSLTGTRWVLRPRCGAAMS